MRQMLSRTTSGLGFSPGWPRSSSRQTGSSQCAATMLREGSLPRAQALQGEGGLRRQPTLSSFSCPRMYADTASQIATTSAKQGREVSASRPASSQPLGKLLAQAPTNSPGKHHHHGCGAGPCPSFRLPAVLCCRGRAGAKRGRGKGSGPGLWPSNPQKGMAPRGPERDLPACWHKRIPWEGTEVLPEETSSRERADFRHFWPARERPGRTAGHLSPRQAGPLVIPEPEPRQVPAPGESWPWMAPSRGDPAIPTGATGLLAAAAPRPGSSGGRNVPRAPWDPQAGLWRQPPALSSHPHSPAAAAFHSGQPRCDPSRRSSQNPYPCWRAAGAWGTSGSAPS